MHALTVRFELPRGTDWTQLRSVITDRAHRYAGLAGLVSKAFVLDEGSGQYGGNYVWASRADLDAFLASELFRGAVARFGPPSIAVHEVVAYVQDGLVKA